MQQIANLRYTGCGSAEWLRNGTVDVPPSALPIRTGAVGSNEGNDAF